MLLMSSMSTRNQFGEFLNSKELLGIAVEIGTHRADFAEQFMSVWKGRLLACVDPWDIPPGYEEQAAMLWGDGNRFNDYKEVVHRMEKFKNRVRLHRCTSMNALKFYDNNTLDFVYIDGDHSIHAVADDLKYWWTRVRSGGIMAGHDFICPNEVRGLWGRYIQPVVINHAEEAGVDIHLIVEENTLPWSWYMEKP